MSKHWRQCRSAYHRLLTAGAGGVAGIVGYHSYYVKKQLEDRNTCTEDSIDHIRKWNRSISEGSTSLLFSSVKNIMNYSNNLPAIAHCEAIETEKERFEKVLSHHRSRISQYRRDWEYKEGGSATTSTKTPSRSWPDNVPSNDDLSFMLEDIKYCNHSPNFRSDKEYCHRLKFRVASALLLQYDEESQKRGMEILRSLAEIGMADAMAFYGICLNEGRAGLDPNAEMAVSWWIRSVALYLHPQSLYELGVAFYTGEGVVEDENKAVELFELAAEQNHPAAAYMLGDCLLDGIGVDVDRGSALEWLVRASELGHRGARSRVMAVLEKKEGEDYGGFTDSSRQTFIEHTLCSANEDGQIIQRRTTLRKKIGGDIGGGPRNPTELQRRETIVSKSRKT